MRPNISEFSYGYALTDELIHWHATPIAAAPVFPSLYQEGQAGGGWDLRLDRPGLPLFLQFKLADCLIRNTAREARENRLTVPYYRMHLRPARFSDQHEMLLDLEGAGNEVYYVAPAFHQPSELNAAYRAHEILARSLWIRPSWIGQLPDDRDHYVAFRQPGAKLFCSEPRRLPGEGGFEEFIRATIGALAEKGRTALQPDRLATLAEQVITIARRKREIPADEQALTEEAIRLRRPLQQIAYYAHVFLDAELFIVEGREA